MVIYSHSRLSSFEQCPLKYKFKYIDKAPPDYESSIEAFLGKKAHETLEWLYGLPHKKNIELDSVIAYFIERWNADFNDQIKIVKEEMRSDHYLNKGMRFLINYFTKNYPFEDNTIATEKKIFVRLDQSGKYQLLGFIDRLVHHTNSNIFEIHDYKTGSLKSQHELDSDRQLALYSIGIRELFPKVSDVHLVWHFLDHGEKKTSTRTLMQLQTLKNEIKRLIQTIESTSEFPPRPSALCNWCEFRSRCPTMQSGNTLTMLSTISHSKLSSDKKINVFEKQSKLGNYS